MKSDYYGYYEPFLANLLAATHNRTKQEFFSTLCELNGVRSIHEKDNNQVLWALDKFNDSELLGMVQKESSYLMLMLRDTIKNGGQATFFDEIPNVPSSIFQKDFESIPFISGNAIGGLIRRLLIKDWAKRIGYTREKYGVPKGMYHELMTGGNISESTGNLDIAKKENYARLCPAIGLLGSALGNMTTTSLIKIGSLRPKCKELGYENEPSFWELLGVQFGTRHDSSKQEMDFEIVGTDTGRNADQMIYYQEVINGGAQLYSTMILNSDDELMTSCFWHGIALWKEVGIIAGKSARGAGRIEVNIDIPQGAQDLYLKHLESVKDEALQYFFLKKGE